MKRILDSIKRWLNLDHQRPLEKEPPNWEDTAPSEYEQMTDDNKVIYRATANPNATNSELDAKIIIHHTNKDGNRDLKGKENEKEAKASS